MNKLVILLVLLIQCQYITASWGDFNKQKKFRYLQVSKTAYCDFLTVKNLTCDSCGDLDVKNIDHVFSFIDYKFKSQNFVYFNVQKNEIVASFRGTSNIRNWLSNINVKKTKIDHICPKCQVHSGFLNVYKSTQFQTEKVIEVLKRKYPTAKIVATGHSLGGAVATIFAAHIIKKQHFKISELVTFGQPRVGNKEFSIYISTQIRNAIRIVNNRDPVPHVPLQKMGFVHHNNLYYYSDSKDISKYVFCKAPLGEESSSSACKKLFNLNIFDHLSYLGKSTDCNDEITKGMKLSSSNKKQNKTSVESMLPKNEDYTEDLENFDLEWLNQLVEWDNKEEKTQVQL